MSRLLFIWLLFAAATAWPREVSPDSQPLTLKQAADFVVERNPRLRSAQFGREVAAAQVDQAALKPQWSVDLQVEDFLGTGAISGFDSSEATLRLSRIFQPSGIRSGRISVASAEGDRTNNQLESERLDLMTLLARRFLEVVHQQERLALASHTVAVWQRARALALARENAGAASPVDRLRTEIRVATAELQLEGAEHELDAARVLLAATWGDPAPDFGTASASLCKLPDLPSYGIVAANIERNPDLLRFATEQRVHDAATQLAEARRQPDFTLSAGVRHVAETSDQALIFSVSVPLGSKPRAAPAARRANALRRRAALEEQDARSDIRATLFGIYQEALHMTAEVQLFDDEILPRAKAILDEIENGYRVGRYSHLELITAQAELLASRSARLSACTNHHLFLIDIERLTGGGAIWLAADEGVSP